ncbi:hypothetical protein G9A89_001586 [Geosiphon pyriformis]|nr:hypothetical protein G9A89_001586 [Geosiphon pyriformis]
MPLNYVDDDAFFGTMNEIGMEELSLVIDNLPNNKAVELLEISNKLWKHCGGEVLVCLLKLLNLYLSIEAVSNLWKKAWVSIIPKPYEWNSVLTNTRPITLVKTAFVEDALKKNRELWLVLQDMCKAYDLVSWHYLVMTDFGLLDSYRVHDELDQGEVFFPLLWRIFYDLLLCKVKRHEHLCRYRVDFKFVAKSGRIETSGKRTFFLTAGTFVDNTIWVGSSQASTQYILNIASEFFVINNISINNDKMVPSLVQTHKDVRFFSNIVLRKAIMDKQFCYLVLAVLQPIVSYCTQFSFVTSDVYHKWDIMIRKDFRAKAGLPHDFPSEVLHHSSLYSLKPFEQFPVKLRVSSVNNFLAEVVKIFLENELSLVNNLSCAFYGSGNFLMSGILGQGPVPYWFFLMSDFMNNSVFLRIETTTATKEDVLSVLDSDRFSEVHDNLLKVWSNYIKVYTDGSLKCAGSVKIAGRVAIYFLAAKAGIGVKVAELLFSTLTELQAVILALKCVLFFCSVVLYSDNQSAIDACISEAFSITPDFHNQCWIERLQIIKRHSDVLGNVRTNVLVNEAIFLSFFLPVKIWERFLSINCAHWETGLGFDIVPDVMIKKIDWNTTATVWHSDLHMLSGFTSRKFANLHTYLMKAVYKQLLIAVRKRLYSRSYSGVLCLLCDKMEFFDHVFTCSDNFGLHGNILVEAAKKWMSMSGLLNSSPFTILLLLLLCSLDMSLYTAVCKGFVMRDWYAKAVLVFEGKVKATQTLVEYIRFVVGLQCIQIWTIKTKHRTKIEKAGLVRDNSVISGLSSSVVSMLLAGVVCMLSVIKSFAVRFGRHKLCYFFSGLSGDAFVTIGV